MTEDMGLSPGDMILSCSGIPFNLRDGRQPYITHNEAIDAIRQCPGRTIVVAQSKKRATYLQRVAKEVDFMAAEHGDLLLDR